MDQLRGPVDADLAETHLSIVVGVGDRVYKLKKPVRFDFVDQSTREQRERLCHQEVDRNRRLAPDVYLGVADVAGPDGEQCDHLVVMRRMPRDRRLSTLVIGGDERVRPALDQLATQLSRFHRMAARSPEITAAAAPSALYALWKANAEEMRPFEGSVFPVGQLDGTLGRADRCLRGREALFARRAADGWICDGHGDLLADDVFVLDDGPRALDCLDFDPRLAYGDVATDVAFLAMDLERLGAPELAAHWLSTYQRASGATIPATLLHLYVAYRAQVRAKVTALRSDQEADHHSATAARDLLQLCDRHLRRATPRLVLVGGTPGTGKSTVARDLHEHFGWRVIRSDVVRKGDPAPTVGGSGRWREGAYSPAATERTYAALLAAAEESLAGGDDVVLDASFADAGHRAAARRFADQVSAEVLELRCTLEPAERDRRIARRLREGTDVSEADAGIAARLSAAADPWPEATDLPTDASPSAVAEKVVALVEQWIRG
ncbi:MAG TPA: AAA family ATPase [Acidimicrobiales bacterium]